jgi:GAF domain-containing protein
MDTKLMLNSLLLARRDGVPQVAAATGSKTEDGPAIGGDGTTDVLLALASLSRALAGDAKLCDVGALLWMLLRQIVPGDTMALFLPDETDDHVVIRYAAGVHAAAIRGVTRPTAMGIAGWTAVNRESVLNGEPSLDLGTRAEAAPALRSCIVVPLVESDALVAVLGIYSTTAAAFTEDHLRLLEVLSSRLGAALIDAAIDDEDSQQVPVMRPRSLKLVQTS